MAKRKRKAPERPKLRNVSGFTGRLVHKQTKEIEKCDWCGVEDAMWIHADMDGKPVHLCFGCGDH